VAPPFNSFEVLPKLTTRKDCNWHALRGQIEVTPKIGKICAIVIPPSFLGAGAFACMTYWMSLLPKWGDIGLFA
jgi:hypothetical protein